MAKGSDKNWLAVRRRDPSRACFAAARETSVELSELIGQAQADLDGGDYVSAAAFCEHGLEHYPACLTLQRMLGECLLEQGHVDPAIEHFQAALNVDPLSVLGWLGMGVAAEEKQDIEAAYACYLHAWEINPSLEHVRDRLVTLRQALGVEPRLHLTRPGLASLHLRAGQFDRAISELQALAAEDPDARRTQIALAEALWRKGDDAGAATVCRDGLEHAPENARYLALLAEIEHRQSTVNAAALMARYQAVDPMGEVAALMMEWRADRDVSPLFRESAPLPELVAPRSETELPAMIVEASVAAQPASRAASTVPLREPALALAGGKGTAGLDAAIQPFAWDEPSVASGAGGGNGIWDDWSDPAPNSAAPIVNSALPNSGSLLASPPSFVMSDGRLDLTAGWDDLDQALADATPGTGALDNYTGLLSELSAEGIAPFDASEPQGDEAAWEPLFESNGGTGLLVDALGPESGALWAAPVPDAEAPALVARTTQPAMPESPVELAAPETAPPVAEIAPAAEGVAMADGHAAGLPESLAPFSLEEVNGPSCEQSDRLEMFEELGVAASRRREHPSSLLAAPSEAMAAALDAMFAEESASRAGQSRVAGMNGGARLAGRSASVFDMLRATKALSVAEPDGAVLELADVSETADAVDPEPIEMADDASSERAERADDVVAAAAAEPGEMASSDDDASDEIPSAAIESASNEAPELEPMFHVEHMKAAPRCKPAPLFSIDPDALLTLRLRLIEEERSAGDVAAMLEAKLAGRQPDPAIARVLGEAYLRLGRTARAAAQYRQAMLARSRERVVSTASSSR